MVFGLVVSTNECDSIAYYAWVLGDLGLVGFDQASGLGQLGSNLGFVEA